FETLQEFDAVLVGRLPETAWPAGLADEFATRTNGTSLLAEGPLPIPVRRALGVEAATPTPAEGSVEMRGEQLRARVEALDLPTVMDVRDSRSVPVSRDSALEWTNVPSLGIDDELAAAWRAVGWDAE